MGLFKVLFLIFVFYTFVLPAIRKLTGMDTVEPKTDDERLIVASTILGMRMGAVDGNFDNTEIQALLRSLSGVSYSPAAQRLVQQVITATTRGNYSEQSEEDLLRSLHIMGNDLRGRDVVLSILADVAKADGVIGAIEVRYFVHVASYFGLNEAEANQRLHSSQRSQRSDYGQSSQGSQSGRYSGAHAQYYEVLGLQPGASQDEIKKRYRELARQLHPDKVSHLGGEIEKMVTAKFQEIQEAYEKIKA